MKYLCLVFLLSIACSDAPVDPNPTQSDLPQLSILDSQVTESSTGSVLSFDIRLDNLSETDIVVDFAVEGVTAEPDIDFEKSNSSVTIPAGSIKTTLDVRILDDEIKEVEEKIRVTLSNAQNATINDAVAFGIIKDDETSEFLDDEGYITSSAHYGYNVVWSEEFEEGPINTDFFNFEQGDHGWGNNELQNYTDSRDNSFIEDGKLVIHATDQGTSAYSSARITTKGKKEFQFGRVDVRAKITKGQGIWPAIWMLGHNIDEVGWPACGEIDIMENVGHEPKICHGTAHWGPQGRGFSTFKGSSYGISTDFSDHFHVFSIVWEENKIDWYIDENKFHTMTPELTNGELYRFNQPFFFIFNVAVGGNWPGRPDSTTSFPQQMEIDYIRVFQ